MQIICKLHAILCKGLEHLWILACLGFLEINPPLIVRDDYTRLFSLTGGIIHGHTQECPGTYVSVWEQE